MVHRVRPCGCAASIIVASPLHPNEAEGYKRLHDAGPRCLLPERTDRLPLLVREERLPEELRGGQRNARPGTVRPREDGSQDDEAQLERPPQAGASPRATSMRVFREGPVEGFEESGAVRDRAVHVSFRAALLLLGGGGPSGTSPANAKLGVRHVQRQSAHVDALLAAPFSCRRAARRVSEESPSRSNSQRDSVAGAHHRLGVESSGRVVAVTESRARTSRRGRGGRSEVGLVQQQPDGFLLGQLSSVDHMPT
mmetsp:Transcript_33573/g.100063  ORF Transcript_33573/g.100063 Transcript_33573/m.100063 type:complete len:253 (+) Transcript_33573:1702-2460(+)